MGKLKPRNQDVDVNSLISAVVTKSRTDLGSLSLGYDDGIVGLPIPWLSLRYLLQSTVLPLSRIWQIAGEEGSAKSAFLYELMRIHMMFGGGAALAENENKDSPVLRKSILEWNDVWINQRLIVKPTGYLEQWQDLWTTLIENMKIEQDRKGGPGRTIPFLFGVDSIMSTAPKEEVDSIKKEGHSQRGYALAANLIARYMRSMPDLIKEYPFTIVGTNHLKPSTDSMGRPKVDIPGGKAVKFMETYEIHMKRAHAGADIDKLDGGGLRLLMTAKKNSLGPSRKHITVELRWWKDPDQDYRQQTYWNWDLATIELLASLENTSGKKTLFNKIKELTGITIASRKQRTAYSDVLGIPSGDPAPYAIVAQKLEDNTEVLRHVHGYLGIDPHVPFQPGVDYCDLLEQSRAFERRQAEQRTAAAQTSETENVE